jgi:hypothetical protein
MSLLIGVEAAGQAELLAWPGERVGAIGQDCRGTGHPEPPRFVLSCHHLPCYLDVGPAFEQRAQAAVQGFRARAVRYVQDVKSHRISSPALAELRASSRPRKARIATI